MANLAVIGTHWGDEGKGKIVDLLADRFDIVARFQGGHNAGHSVVVGDRHYAFHLIPSGILRDTLTCVVGNGVVIDPLAMLTELDALVLQGVPAWDRLVVSDRAHVIAPWHLAYERATETRRALGTTLRGIGPAYATKAERSGIRMVDLLAEKGLRPKVEVAVGLANDRLRSCSWFEAFDAARLTAELLVFGERLRPLICDTSIYLHERIEAGGAVLFEGAQATMLDIDHGTYPFVTSSSASAAGICSGLGIGPKRVDCVVGVTKAYTTRVGEGPMVTELDDEVGQRLRTLGNEYGVSTGRPRRCGWFDAVAGRHSVRVNGMDVLALTLFDILDHFDEIPVCTAYRLANGERVTEVPADTDVLYGATPELQVMRGWKTDLTGVRRFADLPPAARDYMKLLEEQLGAPIGIVSVGAARDASIVREDLFERWPVLATAR